MDERVRKWLDMSREELDEIRTLLDQHANREEEQ